MEKEEEEANLGIQRHGSSRTYRMEEDMAEYGLIKAG